MAATQGKTAAQETPPPHGDAQPFGRMWALDLNGSWPRVQPAIPAKFDRVGPETAALLAAAMNLSGTDEVCRRLESGRRCYGAWVAGELAAYGWVSFEEETIGGLDLRLRLLPGEAYIWDCATLPAMRRLGLYSALLAHILSELNSDGLRRVWIGADLANAPSQAGIACAGFKAVVDLVVSGEPLARRIGLQACPGIAESLIADARWLLLGSRGDESLAARPPAP